MKNLNNILKFLIGLEISAILLYKTFWEDSKKLEKILKVLQDCNYDFIILSIVFGILALISRAMRWEILIKSLGYKSTFSKSFTAIAIGYFSNMIIPRIGEITRCSSMNKMTKTPFNKLFGTVILERIIDLFMMVLLTLIVLIVKKEVFINFLKIGTKDINNNPKNIIYIIGVVFILLIIILFIYKKFKPKIKSFISGVKSGILSIKIIKNKSLFLIHTLFIWLMYFMMTYICFFAFDKTLFLDIKDGIYTMVIGGYGMMLPSLGGTGTYHALVGNGLELLNINETIASAFTLILHGAQSLMTITIGLISVVIFTYKKNK